MMDILAARFSPSNSETIEKALRARKKTPANTANIMEAIFINDQPFLPKRIEPDYIATSLEYQPEETIIKNCGATRGLHRQKFVT